MSEKSKIVNPWEPKQEVTSEEGPTKIVNPWAPQEGAPQASGDMQGATPTSNTPSDNKPATQALAKENKFISGVKGFNRMVERPAEGILQMSLEGAQQERNTMNSAFSGLAVDKGRPEVSPKSQTIDAMKAGLDKNHRRKELEYNQSWAQNPYSTGFGATIGALATAAAGGTVGAAGKIGARILGGAVVGGAHGGAQYVEEGGSRAENTLMGTVLGAGMSGILGAGGALKRHFMPSRKVARTEMAQALKQAPARVDKNLAAAKQEGVLLTPGEASQSGLIKTMEATAKPKATQQIRLDAAKKLRDDTLRKKTNKLTHSLTPEGGRVAEKTSEALYKQSKNIPVPRKNLNKVTKNPEFMTQYKSLHASKKSNMHNTKMGTVGWLDGLKKDLDDEIADNIEKKAHYAKRLMKLRDKVVGVADDASPDYKAARQISGRVQAKEKLLGNMKKMDTPEGIDKNSAAQFYQANMSSTEKKVRFAKEIKNAGGDVKQALGVMRILSATKSKSNLEKVSTKSLDSQAKKFGGGPTHEAYQGFSNLLKGGYNDEIVEIMLDPNWKKKLEPLMNSKVDDWTKLGMFGQLISRAIAGKTGDATDKLKGKE